jgi:hypothetical protein
MNQNYYQVINTNNSYQDNQYYPEQNNEIVQYQRYQQEEDEEEDIDTSTAFNDYNEEFVSFKNNVREWLLLDDDIIKLQAAIRERKKKKDDLTPLIQDFMKNFEINDLNTNDGNIKFTKSSYTKPLNKQFLSAKLADFFKDSGKGEAIATYLLNNRDKEEKFKLKRILNKKSINI